VTRERGTSTSVIITLARRVTTSIPTSSDDTDL
jgi:hypothetical protein